MYPFYREIELLGPVFNHFKKQGYEVSQEVRIGFCRADVVALKNDIVIAIELKLRDWRNAIVQVKNYQLGADYVYIAFPMMKSYSVLRKAEITLKREGIGLLIVNEITCKISEIIHPKLSTKKIGKITFKEINKTRLKIRI